MSRYLDVACPTCASRAGEPCTYLDGGFMTYGHYARTSAATASDGVLGPADPEDTIEPLPDLRPQAVLDPYDTYPHLAVLRWARDYEETTYIYVAIKIATRGWFLSGSRTEPLQWDELWNKYLVHALWIERAASWTTLKI